MLMRRSIGAFTPLLGNRVLYLRRLYSLGQMLEASRRTGEANAVWEDLLKLPKIPPVLEADIRTRLANGLETLGEGAEATRQRTTIEMRLQEAEGQKGMEWALLLERGKNAADGNRFSEARSLFERSLAAPKPRVLPAQRRMLEVEITARLGLAAQQEGDAQRTESAARFVVENGTTPFWRSQGFRILALGLSGQGKLSDALEASNVALQETEKMGDVHAVLDCQGAHATLLMSCGQVRQALAECEAAANNGVETSRVASHVASNCCLLLGDYEGAREWLERARRAPHVSSPSAERQMQGLLDMDGASTEHAAMRFAGQDRALTAWDLLQRAKPNIAGFDRLLFWLSASETLTLALLGKDEAARANIPRIEEQLQGYEGDAATQNAVWTWLAKTYMELGEWSEAEKWWRVYLDAGHGRPVFRPDALCGLGECLRAQEDEVGARRCWQEVVDIGFDIADTVRACKFLEVK